ncbi:PREDICTED: venom protease-like [Papilio polytes]|uniref:venom protease-like n=1 Tax=Papilio polytes TaxID=76194 RepID=UPI000675F1BE|nr:PREDICTED: venom protease-like [Papilio polytes]
MEKVWCVIFLLINVKFLVAQEGEECELEEAEGVFGECKPTYLCSYTDRLINKENQQPTVCFANTTDTFVCCPKTLYQTGILGRTFFDSINGRLTYGDIDCRYTGSFPLVCCKRKPVEPATRLYNRLGEDCDRKPNTKTAEACKACYTYQRPRSSNIVCPEEAGIRIAGGEPAEIEQFPHMVVLGTRIEQKPNPSSADIDWIGAGTLITETFVLTAAHVLYSPDNGNIQYALLGTSNKTDLRDGVLRYIVQRIRHKLYTSGSHNHDIALVELDYRVPLSKFIRPACLPVDGIVPDTIPTLTTVAGWGRTGQYANASQKLMQGDMRIQSTKICRKGLTSRFQSWDPNIMFCAKAETADTCYGDSGGPVMAPLKENSMLCGYYVVGIVSFGTVCGVNSPGAYTNVKNPSYLEWISNIVWPQSE